jgi:hypothetical protein
VAKSWGGARHRSRPATAFAASSASRRSPATAALDLSVVLVDAVSSVSTGQLEWQDDRTGRVSWQRADLHVAGHRADQRATYAEVATGPRGMIVGAAGKQVLLLWDVDHTLIEGVGNYLIAAGSRLGNFVIVST